VTLQPVEQLGVDAAILFSDILVPLPGMGIDLNFTEEGPQVAPVRSADDIARLRVADPDSCGYVYEAIRLCRQALAARGEQAVPLIGFAGAPFTLLTYAVEGHTSKQFIQTKKLLFADRDTAHVLLRKLTETVIGYLRAQVEAGAQAIQIFDSWVGILGQAEFAEFAAPYVEQVLQALRPLGVPLIYFAHGGSALYEQVGALSADVFSVDWRLPIDRAAQRLGIGTRPERAIQGNLDPLRLLSPIDEIERQVEDILRRASTLHCRHIFNLGHGVVPQTSVAHVRALVEAVHRLGAQPRAHMPAAGIATPTAWVAADYAGPAVRPS
jgi:uroporphyrinogen decarboxylase